MSLALLYTASTVLLALGGLFWAVFIRRQGAWQRMSTTELATLAMMVCVLHVSLLPFKAGLSKLPGVSALVFSIPYTVSLLVTLRLVPKPGAAALLIASQALLGQLMGSGLNPLMWPYHLWCALVVEAGLAASGGQLRHLGQAVAIACGRGLVAYAYMYLLVAPLFWRKYYAPWYVGTLMACGAVGCVIGALAGWRLGERVVRAAANPLG